MSESVRDLLVRGIAAAKDGAKVEARRYLEWALRLDPTDAQCLDAWLWLSAVSDDPAEKRRYLEQILAYDPFHPEARRALTVLDGRLKPEEIIDADRFKATAPDTLRPTQARQFTCPQCGGRMVYNPQGQLVCEYCEQRQAISAPEASTEEIEEQDFILTLATAKGHAHPVATPCMRCRACGASFVLSPEMLSFTCPYCAATYAVEQMEMQDLVPPEAIIPFAVDRTEAERLLTRWLEAERQTSSVRATPLAGTYLPAWTFDVWCVVPQEVWEDGEYTVDRKRFHLDDVPVPAGWVLPESLMDEVDRFNLAGLVSYDARYLAGWPAATYQVSPANASLVARQKIVNAMHRKGQVSLFVESFKLILLPLWIARYRDGEAQVTVIVNGQTGAVRSDRPKKGVRKWLSWLTG